jgi:hypothetical protein
MESYGKMDMFEMIQVKLIRKDSMDAYQSRDQRPDGAIGNDQRCSRNT